jgi:hypothetical protein
MFLDLVWKSDCRSDCSCLFSSKTPLCSLGPLPFLSLLAVEIIVLVGIAAFKLGCLPSNQNIETRLNMANASPARACHAPI